MTFNKKQTMTRVVDTLSDLILVVKTLSDGRTDNLTAGLEQHAEFFAANRSNMINASGSLGSGIFQYQDRVLDWNDGII